MILMQNDLIVEVTEDLQEIRISEEALPGGEITGPAADREVTDRV